MPVAIIIKPGAVPAALFRASENQLVQDVAAIAGRPLLTVSETRQFLANMPAPSGWFDTLEDAASAAERQRSVPAMAPGELAQIRAAIGLSRADFARAIGYHGNSNTGHKQVFEMENGKKPISAEKAAAARALAALRAIDNARDRAS
jgi:DNA-binding transcriptional regulator YiaG